MRQSERGRSVPGVLLSPGVWGAAQCRGVWRGQGTVHGPAHDGPASIGRLALSSGCRLPARTRRSADQAFPTGMKTQQDHSTSFPSRPWFFVASIETHMEARWWSLHKLIVCHVSPRLSLCA